MKKEHCEFAPPVTFGEQTPEMEVKPEKRSALYERTYLSREPENDSEYTRNTTTWDS